MRSATARTAIAAATAALLRLRARRRERGDDHRSTARATRRTPAGIVTITGAGFTPGEQYTVLVQGGVVDVGNAAADGTLVKRIAVPVPPESGPGAHTGTYGVEVRQADVAATGELPGGDRLRRLHAGLG